MMTPSVMGRIEQLMQFVESNPSDPFPRYGLAMELKNTGRLVSAERLATDANLVMSDRRRFIDSLGDGAFF